MPYQATTLSPNQRTVTVPTSRPNTAPRTAGGDADRRHSVDGIGDIVQAGQASSYPHLCPHERPTVGQLHTAAQRAAHTATGWGTVTGAQPGGVAAGGVPPAADRWRRVSAEDAGPVVKPVVKVVALRPTEFVPLPIGRGTAGLGGVLYLASGHAHMVAVSATGRLLSVRELSAGRGRVVAEPGGFQLINTGSEPAVVVFAAAG